MTSVEWLLGCALVVLLACHVWLGIAMRRLKREGVRWIAGVRDQAGLFQRTVECEWCGNRYRSSVPGDLDRGLQGSHCASDVVRDGDQWVVRGGYGSDEHDMKRYAFVANHPTSAADPVCDECISQRLSAGDLVEVTIECYRTGRLEDFSPRPHGTCVLVNQIRGLSEDAVAMRKLVDVAIRASDSIADPRDAVHAELADAVRAYRKHQRWTGEIDDGGEEYADGAHEVASQMREAARQIDGFAEFWESKAIKGTP